MPCPLLSGVMIMRRGTTPTNTITTNVDLTDATAIYLTYAQKGRVVFEKTKEDMDVTQDKISVRLSQNDTLSLNDLLEVKIQIRALFGDGTAIASNIMVVPVKAILKDGEI